MKACMRGGGDGRVEKELAKGETNPHFVGSGRER